MLYKRCACRVAKHVFKVGQLVEMIGLILPMAHHFNKLKKPQRGEINIARGIAPGLQGMYFRKDLN
ncbi:MAG: hypothetical protein DRR08_18795 [Candidatus Parabeggiatoa sp. nov. 2]|nr:MAG: hypothetical protein B6247_11735 [Beggiatoa sp. 4572_84]RKZ57518.1 MAG: hypothetical protein DRR08_18795 [Gammaproteobacteria bacterium]